MVQGPELPFTPPTGGCTPQPCSPLGERQICAAVCALLPSGHQHIFLGAGSDQIKLILTGRLYVPSAAADGASGSLWV